MHTYIDTYTHMYNISYVNWVTHQLDKMNKFFKKKKLIMEGKNKSKKRKKKMEKLERNRKRERERE